MEEYAIRADIKNLKFIILNRLVLFWLQKYEKIATPPIKYSDLQ